MAHGFGSTVLACPLAFFAAFADPRSAPVCAPRQLFAMPVTAPNNTALSDPMVTSLPVRMSVTVNLCRRLRTGPIMGRRSPSETPKPARHPCLGTNWR
jgi:hypothetical protein